MQKMFRYPIFSETQKVSPTKFFDTVRHQLFDGELWCPVFLLTLKFFNARSFLKHRRDHLQSFSALWEKRFPTETSDIPVLCKRCFETRIFLKHGRGPLQNFLALWDNFFSNEISDMPFLCIRFFGTRSFLKQRGVPLWKFSVLWDKDFDKKSWYTPSSLVQKNFRYPKFFETQT